MKEQRIQVSATSELFPLTFKDVASGVYFTELKLPGDGVLNSVEVIVDSNLYSTVRESPDLFRRLAWILGPGTTVHVNVAYFAFEQFLSNKASALEKLKGLTTHPALLGSFPDSFAESFLAECSAIEPEIKQLIGKLSVYLFVMRSLYEQDIVLEDKLKRWRSLYEHDVPRLTTLYYLGLIFFHAKANSDMVFAGNNRKVQDWASHFFGVRKEEKDDPCRWARNRLFDLIPLYGAPLLNIEKHGGKPGRLITATRDVYTAECLYRLFAFSGEQQAEEPWVVIVNLSSLQARKSVVEEINAAPLPMHADQSVERRKARIKNLIDASMTILSQPRRDDLVRTLDSFEVWNWLTQ